MAQAESARAINRGGKNSVRNLRYGPRTRLVRGTYNIRIVYIIIRKKCVFMAECMGDVVQTEKYCQQNRGKRARKTKQAT